MITDGGGGEQVRADVPVKDDRGILVAHQRGERQLAAVVLFVPGRQFVGFKKQTQLAPLAGGEIVTRLNQDRPRLNAGLVDNAPS